MYLGIRLFLLLTLVSLLECSCFLSSKNFVGDWPIAELTLPDSATVLSQKKPKASGGTLSTATWTKFIRCDEDYNAFRAHVEGCLQPLKYSRMWVADPQHSDAGLLGDDYYSPDQRTRVMVMNLDNPARRADSSKALFVVTITLLDKPFDLQSIDGKTTADGTIVHVEQLE